MPDSKHPELEAMQVVHRALEPLKPDAQRRVIDWVVSVLKPPDATASAPGGGSALGGAGSNPSVTNLQATIEAFVTTKKPKDTYQRLACLGYYLEFKEKKVDLSGKDLTKANTDARQAKIGNMADFLIKAEKRHGFFTEAGYGKKRLSARGKAVVEALPSQEAVKTALINHPLPKHGGGRGKAKKTKK